VCIGDRVQDDEISASLTTCTTTILSDVHDSRWEQRRYSDRRHSTHTKYSFIHRLSVCVSVCLHTTSFGSCASLALLSHILAEKQLLAPSCTLTRRSVCDFSICSAIRTLTYVIRVTYLHIVTYWRERHRTTAAATAIVVKQNEVTH